jgi:cell division protein FtsL
MKNEGNSNLVPMALAAFVIVSSVVVVQVKHRNRTLNNEIEKLRVEHEHLDMEWAQLQLEQATLAQHARVEQLARKQFGMVEPPQSMPAEKAR